MMQQPGHGDEVAALYHVGTAPRHTLLTLCMYNATASVMTLKASVFQYYMHIQTTSVSFAVS